MPQPRQGYSSLGRSIAANYPNYPDPTESNLEPSNFYGTSVLATMNPPVVTNVRTGAPVVNSAFRRKGMRYLYSCGARMNSWFKMIATGAVESTKFQPITDHVYDASFNDALYEAGYPQNLGLSFKVPTIPNGIATTDQWGRMRPQPQYTRSIYTRRRFSSAPAVAAQPSAK